MEAVARPWLSARAAAMRLGINRYALLKRVASGQIRTKADPGSSVKFLAADVEKLASQDELAAAVS